MGIKLHIRKLFSKEIPIPIYERFTHFLKGLDGPRYDTTQGWGRATVQYIRPKGDQKAPFIRRSITLRLHPGLLSKQR
jgi:hypothetical protein